MNDAENAVFESKIDWEPLDLVIRGWVALSGFEKDQENYKNLADLYNFKSV